MDRAGLMVREAWSGSQIHASQDVVVAQVAADTVESRIYGQPAQPERMVLKGPVQVFQSLVLIPEPDIRDSDVIWRDVPLCRLRLQPCDRLFRLRFLSRNCIGVTKCACVARVAPRGCKGLLELGNSLPKLRFLLVEQT